MSSISENSDVQTSWNRENIWQNNTGGVHIIENVSMILGMEIIQSNLSTCCFAFDTQKYFGKSSKQNICTQIYPHITRETAKHFTIQYNLN